MNKKINIISDNNIKSKKIKFLLIKKLKKSKIFETKLEDNNWWRWIYVKNLKKK